MAAITICSDFGAPKNKVWHCFHCLPIYSPFKKGWNIAICKNMDGPWRYCTMENQTIRERIGGYHRPVVPNFLVPGTSSMEGFLPGMGRGMVWVVMWAVWSGRWSLAYSPGAHLLLWGLVPKTLQAGNSPRAWGCGPLLENSVLGGGQNMWMGQKGAHFQL